MARRGRPWRNNDAREIRERSANNRRSLLERIKSATNGTMTERDHALVAARVLHTLVCGTEAQKEKCRPLVTELRRYDQAKELHRWDKDTDFLVAFIGKHWPGGQLWDCIDDATGPERTERRINEMAEMRRHSRALRERFVTPGKPDSTMLLRLRRLRPHDATTWPTLLDLKMATAFLEPKIKTILAKLHPKPANGEITKPPLRHVFTTRGAGSKRGALPKRYHPRLVLAVINVFIRDLADYPIRDEERKCVREVAMTVKRALTQQLRASDPST